MTTQPKHRIYVTRKQRSRENENITPLIRRSIKATLEAEGIIMPCEVNVLITNDPGIREINKNTRNIDKPTDVLSFPTYEFKPGDFDADESFLDPGSGRLFLGDIALSLERATAQAKEYKHGRDREIGYLVIHSTLHLLGYDHMDEGPNKALMRGREREILKRTGIYENE